MNIFSLFFIFPYVEFLAETSALRKSRIIGGDEAFKGQFPYMVSINFPNDHQCGGAIIADQYVLSAAHCFILNNGNFHGKEMLIQIGASDLLDEGNDVIFINAVKIYVPKEYRPQDNSNRYSHAINYVTFRGTGDIAVLKLKNPIRLAKNPKLKALQLPKDDGSNYIGRAAYVTGYGWNKIIIKIDQKTHSPYEAGGSTDYKLRYAKSIIVSNQHCQFLYKNINDKHICAQMKPNDVKVTAGVCTKDSGSPLVLDGNIVIGVVNSSPSGCRETYYPAVYTRVSSFVNFIENAMNGMKDSSMRSATLKWPNLIFSED